MRLKLFIFFSFLILKYFGQDYKTKVQHDIDSLNKIPALGSIACGDVIITKKSGKVKTGSSTTRSRYTTLPEKLISINESQETDLVESQTFYYKNDTVIYIELAKYKKGLFGTKLFFQANLYYFKGTLNQIDIVKSNKHSFTIYADYYTSSANNKLTEFYKDNANNSR